MIRILARLADLRVQLRTRPWRVSTCERNMRARGMCCANPGEHLLP